MARRPEGKDQAVLKYRILILAFKPIEDTGNPVQSKIKSASPLKFVPGKHFS